MRNNVLSCVTGMLALLLVAGQASAWAAPGVPVDFDASNGPGVSAWEKVKSMPKESVPAVKGKPVERPGHDRRGSWRDGRRDDRGRPGAKPWDGQRVQGLAAQIAAQAEAARAKYRQEKPGNFFKKISWASGYNPLESFTDKARDFSREVQRRFREADEMWDAYASMIDSWVQVERNLPSAYRSDRIRAEYHALQDQVNELRFYFRHLEARREAMEKVKELGKEVKAESQALLDQAESIARSQEPAYEDRRFLDDLRDVAGAAGDLERETGRYRPEPREIVKEAEDLVRAYERADDSFYGARMFESLRYEFRRLGDKVGDIEDAAEDFGGRRR